MSDVMMTVVAFLVLQKYQFQSPVFFGSDFNQAAFGLEFVNPRIKESECLQPH